VQDQVAWLTVVSNDDGVMDRLAALDAGRLTHVRNSGNAGLAAALNMGLAHSRDRGFAWCLLLDQDTVVDEDLLTGLADAYSAYPDHEKIGFLVPNYRSPGGTRLAYCSDVAWQTVATAVTSGSLVPLAVIEQLGGMREAFFIEGIDIEFSLRVRAAGFHVVATGRPLMTHGAGAAEERRLFGRTVLVSHHSSWRCFLQYRNLTWTLLRYGGSDPKWTGLTLLAMLKRICLVCLFERQRCAKLWAMLRGTLVGIGQALRRIEGNSRGHV
jgi:rhamnosyltransferase